MRVAAIMVANGSGERFGSTIPKPLMSLNGRPVIDYSVAVIEPLVDQVIIVSPEPYKAYAWTPGGATRSESVEHGLALVEADVVIVHDSVRPYVTTSVVSQVIELLRQGAQSVDTVTNIVDGYLEVGVDAEGNGAFFPKSKANRLLGLTPEGFQTDTLREAFGRAPYRHFQDEVTMVHQVLGYLPELVVDHSTVHNKLTYAQDLTDAEGVLKFRQEPIQTVPRLLPTLVLGGSGGIGAAVCDLLGEDARRHGGRRDINLARPDFQIDLSRYFAVVHAAGTFGEHEMEVNFNSCVRLIQIAEEQAWTGNIVFLSSTAATFGRRGYALYSASKAALNAYIEAEHERLAARGIFINAVAPARTDTPLQRRLNPDTPEEAMIDPKYVADMVARYTDTEVSGHIIYLRKGLDI